MVTTLIKMYEGQPAAANTTLYTAAANTRVRITAATVTNDSATARYISFHLVPSGGAVGDAYLILNQRVIGDKESYTLPELIGHVMDTGDFLSAIAEAADALSVQISGIAVT